MTAPTRREGTGERSGRGSGHANERLQPFAERFRVEREEFRMVLPCELNEDSIGENLFHERDVPLAGGALRLAEPVLDGAWRVKY